MRDPSSFPEGMKTLRPIDIGINPDLVSKQSVHAFQGLAHGQQSAHLRAIQAAMGQSPATFELTRTGGATYTRATLAAGGRRISLPMESAPLLYMYGGRKVGLPEVHVPGLGAMDPLEHMARAITEQPGWRKMSVSQRMDSLDKIAKRYGGQISDQLGYGPTRVGGAMHMHRGLSVLHSSGDVYDLVQQYQKQSIQTTGVLNRPGPGAGNLSNIMTDAGRGGFLEGSVQIHQQIPRQSIGLFTRTRQLLDLGLELRDLDPGLTRAMGQKKWEQTARGLVLPGSTPEDLYTWDPSTFGKGKHQNRAFQVLRAGDLEEVAAADARAIGREIGRLAGEGKPVPQSLWAQMDRLRGGQGRTIVRSAGMHRAEGATRAGMQFMGLGRKASGQNAHLAAHATMMRMVPKNNAELLKVARQNLPNATGAELRAAARQYRTDAVQAIQEMFGDSSVFVSSAGGARFAAINNEYRELVLPLQAKDIGSGHMGYVNPRLQQAVGSGLGQPRFEKGAEGWVGLTYDDITRAAEEAGERFHGQGIGGHEGLLGWKIDEGGNLLTRQERYWDVASQSNQYREAGAAVRMRPGEEITGALLTDSGSLRLQIMDAQRRKRWTVMGGEGMLWGDRRIGAQDIMSHGRFSDPRQITTFTASGLKSGGVPIAPGDMLHTAAYQAFEIADQRGVDILAKNLRAYGVDVGSEGGTGLFFGDDYLKSGDGYLWQEGKFRQAVEKTASELGVPAEELRPLRMSLSHLKGEIASRTGRDSGHLLQVMEGMRVVGTASKRGAMSVLGKTGAVALRLDDLRGHHLSVAQATKGLKNIPGAEGRVQRWLGEFEQEVLGASKSWRGYLQATAHATATDRSALTGGKNFREIDINQFRRDFKPLGDLPADSMADALQGTHYVKKVGNKWVLSDENLLVTGLDDLDLRLPYARGAGTKGVKAGAIALASGVQLFGEESDRILRHGERATLDGRKLPGKSYTAASLELRDLLHETGASREEVMRAAGASHLTLMERTFGKEGRLRRMAYTPEASITATIGTHESVQIGEVGLSVKKLKQMGLEPIEIAHADVSPADLRAAGFELTDETAQQVRDIRKKVKEGSLPSLKLQTQIQPALSGHHRGPRKVRVIPHTWQRNIGGEAVELSSDRIMAMNDFELALLNRDKDYDMAYGFMTRKTKQGFDREQKALDDIFRANEKQRRAVQLVQKDLRADDVKDFISRRGAIVTDLEYGQMADEGGDFLAQLESKYAGRGVSKREIAERLYMAKAQTMVETPGQLTGLMDYHWRRARALSLDLIQGKGNEAFKWAEGINLADQHVDEALGILRSKQQNIAHLMDVFSASSYTVLKKEAMEAATSGSAAHVIAERMADPALQAAWVASGRASGSAARDQARLGLSNQIYTALEKAQGLPLKVMAYSELGGMTPAHMKRMADRLARTGQALSTLMLGQTSGGMDIAMESYNEVLLQRSGVKVVNRGGQLQELFGAAGIYGHAGVEVPDAFMATGASGMSGEAWRASNEALQDGATKTVSQAARNFADAGAEALKKIQSTKWGKVALGAGAVISAIGIGRSLFGSSSSPGEQPGAPMPPSPLLDRPDSPDLDFNNFQHPNYANVERVPGMRTHLSVSGSSADHDMSFVDIGDASFGRLGIRPTNSGSLMTDSNSAMYSHQLDAEIRQRMHSTF